MLARPGLKLVISRIKIANQNPWILLTPDIAFHLGTSGID